MEALWYFMFWAGVLTAGAATAMGLTYALVPGVAVRSAATNVGTVQVPVFVPATPWLRDGSRAMAWAAVAFLVAYFGFRWKATGLPPASNMWEYTVAFGWTVVLFGRFVDWRFRAWGLNLVLLVGALVLFGIAEATFSSNVGSPHIHLQANRHLLALHVSTMLVAFGGFAVAFAGAGGYLAQRFAGKPNWLPEKDVLEEASNGAVRIGFLFFTVGLAFGSYWMYSLWGKYWDWDAKASSSFVAWLTYAAYFHTNMRRGWHGPTAPLLLIAGFAAVMFSYFAVNLWSYFGSFRGF